MTPLSCSSVRRRLTAFYDRELPVPALIAIEAHLEGCPPCAREAEQFEEIGEALRFGAALLHGEAEDLAGLEPGVISRMNAENAESWSARFGRTFEDLHLVWIGLSSAMATVLCGAVALGCLHFAAPERDDSLAGIIAAMASSKANLVRQIPADTYDDLVANALVRTMSDDEVVSALAASVTREGRLIDPRAIGDRDRRELDLMNALSGARFDQTNGSQLKVSMVWILAHTTVRGDKTVG